jgi:plasmid stabilization system protein ParE
MGVRRMADVTFLPAAEADYQAAVAWYRARSPQAAAGFEAAVADGVQRIADNPELYGLVDDRHRRCLLRRYPYSLVYRVESAGVLVVAVAHSARSSSYWQSRA